jgi:hypothetical protein
LPTHTTIEVPCQQCGAIRVVLDSPSLRAKRSKICHACSLRNQKKPERFVEIPCQQCGKVRSVRDQPSRIAEAGSHCVKCVQSALAEPLDVRLWRRVDFDGPAPSHRPELGPCHLWTGPVNTGPPGTGGYGWIGLGDGTSTTVHRVAWNLHYGRWPDPCALHRCDVRRCVRWEHLFEGTRADNNADMTEKGRNANMKGERNPAHKVTADEVREIRRRYAAGGVTQQELGNEFGLTQGIISHMIVRRTWKSVD